MRFLIDGSRARLVERWQQWPDGVCGQLITPLTNYTRASNVYAIDNGAFSGFDVKRFQSLLARNRDSRGLCLFVAIPDKVGCHVATLAMFHQYAPLCAGWPLAFVLQDGCDSVPDGVSALFVGGTTAFKDSAETLQIVRWGVAKGYHVHVGRVNQKKRFLRFNEAGAHTCDGSGVSRFKEKLPPIRLAWENRFNV